MSPICGKHRRCTRCIMDTTDPDITFDANGVCNHCHRYDELLDRRVFSPDQRQLQLAAVVARIKSSGEGKKYDCIIGVSGGVDSTYVAYLAKDLGLRPLAVHFDNGWNSELAVANIERVLTRLGIDLHTYVVDWPTFRDLQLAFLHSSTPDGEIPTDHAINALLFREASRRGIRYVINGMNFATEGMAVESWAYGHADWKYIRKVHARFGKRPLRGYPKFSFLDLFYWTVVKRIRVVSILNYIEYRKADVMALLQNELGWVYYGGKHYESVYTRFYQGYILPEKFEIDKRIGHLSDLIRSGQMTRKEALAALEEPRYDPDLLKRDREFVLKKLGLTPEGFDAMMASPTRSFREYPNSYRAVMALKKLVNRLRGLGLYAR